MPITTFQKFNFKTVQDLDSKAKELGLQINWTDDLSPLAAPVAIGSKRTANAFAVLPMEGCDCNPDGSPSELARRRYVRFAKGGAGLLWYEACAVVHEGRANPLQLYISPETKAAIRAMRQEAEDAAAKAFGSQHRPISILQLTHSGRYSRPHDQPAPMIAQHDPLLDGRVGLTDASPVVSDEYLDMLLEKYVQAALMAQECGFDGVDVKACHRYLISELLASHLREGRYGGSFENRTRFLLEAVRKIRQACGEDFIVASRFNAYDAHPYPYGFGVSKEDFRQYDLTEPAELTRQLVAAGANLLTVSAGNPYYIQPQVTRPFDLPVVGAAPPQEHPLVNVDRLFQLTKAVQQAAGKVPVIGGGYSWLRQLIPQVGAANLRDGSAAKDLYVSYGHVNALNGISLDVEKGKIVSIIGSNGAGKSTLINAISGVVKPKQGSILFEGKKLSSDPHKVVRAGITQVPEGRKVFDGLSIEENLVMGGISKPAREEKARKEMVYDLFPYLREQKTQQAGTLSGGQQQMLAIARGLMAEPKLLLLDEPSLGLAPIMVKSVFTLIQNIRDMGYTILLIEQSAQQALKLSDYAYVLENGCIKMKGPAEDILNDETIISAYLGEQAE